MDNRLGQPEQSARQRRKDNEFILLVEDDNDVALAVLELFDAEGIAVSRAQNGQEALDVLAGGPPPCLVILDLMMPVMNGWEFLELIRGPGPYEKLPVAVFSAMIDERAKKYAQWCLQKPVSIDQVVTMLDELFGNSGRSSFSTRPV